MIERMRPTHIVVVDDIVQMIRDSLLNYMGAEIAITGFREVSDGFLIDINSQPSIAIHVRAVERNEDD